MYSHIHTKKNPHNTRGYTTCIHTNFINKWNYTIQCYNSFYLYLYKKAQSIMTVLFSHYTYFVFCSFSCVSRYLFFIFLFVETNTIIYFLTNTTYDQMLFTMVKFNFYAK